MVGRNPERLRRLMSLRDSSRGYVWLAAYDRCGHASELPVRSLIARYGELFPVERAMAHFRCAECQHTKVTARCARLCDPGCGRQRG